MKKLKKGQNLYIVNTLTFSISICTKTGNPLLGSIPLIWEDGQIGAVPVFTNKKKKAFNCAKFLKTDITLYTALKDSTEIFYPTKEKNH